MNINSSKAALKNSNFQERILFITKLTNLLTDGDFGRPTLCPHVVSKLTRPSRTFPCDIHGRFHPLNGAVSAGDKLVLRLGELGVPEILFVVG
jgi:hypothetical protein